MIPISDEKQKRAVAFVDGQNLFRHAKSAFGHDYPNYDPLKLFKKICADNGWRENGVKFYTGVPDQQKDPKRHRFWQNKLLAMSRSGVLVTKRTLRYHTQEVTLADGTIAKSEIAKEKGIDVRLALDVIHCVIAKNADVIVIFSQDQDLSEVVRDAKQLARESGRDIEVHSAYPISPTATCSYGIKDAKKIEISQALYESCLDLRDYR